MSAVLPLEPLSQVDFRGVAKCRQSDGWHVYAAGPCFFTTDEAIDYRDRLDFAVEVYWPDDKQWPPKPPEGWINPRSQELGKGKK